jgi:hypothetical protein
MMCRARGTTPMPSPAHRPIWAADFRPRPYPPYHYPLALALALALNSGKNRARIDSPDTQPPLETT